MSIELMISDASGAKAYMPAVEEGIEWETERRGSPGKLTFKVLGDSALKVQEGAAVRLKVNGAPVFFGFIFSCKWSKDNLVTITAYDQLRYLSNKDTYVYENKTVAELIRMIADDFRLSVGALEDPGFKIASRVEDNTSLFDMIGNALDLTLQNTQKMYVLYDDFGKLVLKSLESMKVGGQGTYLMIDESSGESFECASSIDSDTYNKIKLTYDNDDTGKREVYIAQDGAHINEWGVLQYFDTLSKGENGQAKADALLHLYNKKTRNLKISNAFGDIRVRGGSMIIVRLNFWGLNLKNFMLVEKVKHTFKENQHFMDLTFRGGEFVA